MRQLLFFLYIISAYQTKSLISMKSSTPLYKLLRAKKGDVAELVTHARQLGHLSDIVQAILEPSLANHCQLAHFDGSRMVLVADTPAWASRLRFSINTLLAQLKQYSNKFHALSEIEVQVKPQLPSIPEPATRERVLTAEAARCLNESAEVIEDTALKQALLRLSKRYTDKNQ